SVTPAVVKAGVIAVHYQVVLERELWLLQSSRVADQVGPRTGCARRQLRGQRDGFHPLWIPVEFQHGGVELWAARGLIPPAPQNTKMVRPQGISVEAMKRHHGVARIEPFRNDMTIGDQHPLGQGSMQCGAV